MIVDPMFQVVAGWTEPLLVDLLIDGATFNPTGMTMTATLTDKTGTSTALSVDFPTSTVSQARINPSAGTFVHSSGPYWVRFKIVDGGGKIAYWPPTEAGRIEVYKA